MFWLHLLVIVVLAALFWKGVQERHAFSREGLLIGLSITLRVLLVVIGFSGISSELRNPALSLLLSGSGLRPLYGSLELAFAALPAIMSRLPAPGRFLRHPLVSVADLLVHADHLLGAIERRARSVPEVFFVTGAVGEGKTTFVGKVADALKRRGLSLAGILAEGIDRDRERVGFRLRDLRTGEGPDLCRKDGPDHWPKCGPFRFDPDALAFGQRLLGDASTREADVVIVDEVGPMELRGEGWGPGLGELLRCRCKPMLWAVRRPLVPAVRERWELHDAPVLDIGAVSPDTAADRVSAAVAKP
jgi:iron complex transport system ATP-binding protein